VKITQDISSSAGYVQVEISDIEVTNNQITVGVYSGAPNGSSVAFDDASLTGE